MRNHMTTNNFSPSTSQRRLEENIGKQTRHCCYWAHTFHFPISIALNTRIMFYQMAQPLFKHLLSGLDIFWNTTHCDFWPLSLSHFSGVGVRLCSHPDEHVLCRGLISHPVVGPSRQFIESSWGRSARWMWIAQEQRMEQVLSMYPMSHNPLLPPFPYSPHLHPSLYPNLSQLYQLSYYCFHNYHFNLHVISGSFTFWA
jgi:hypothetical protein